ncbi:MAG: CoA transferase [Alphaproteobacteria bacterium]|nr:CoA transferase [Alphaproteobacteria bacterium]
MDDLHKRDYATDAPAPLDGVRVLDLSRLVAGNALTHVLADFGAEVIKVERPGHGDDLRSWRVEGISAFWKVYARNKKSITLNPRSSRGRALLLQLVESAQVLVENFLPGTLEKWGLGPDVLLDQNPALVIVRISGWGQTGPDRDNPGFGSLVEARTGFAAMNGFPDRPPALPPLALADMIAGMYGGMATLTALRNVEVRGGKGQVIDLPLFDPMLAILGPQAAEYQLTGRVPARAGSRSAITAPRNTYRCKDGHYVALSASMQSMAERLFKTIGREDLIEDPRFLTNGDRVANNDILDPIIAEFMGRHDRAKLLELFQAAGVTVGPVHDTAGMMADDMVREREVMLRFPDKEMGDLPMHNVAAHLSETPGQIRSPAPELGQHNSEIFGSLGLTPQEIAALVKEDVI